MDIHPKNTYNSPISKLPVEILANILVLAIRGNHFTAYLYPSRPVCIISEGDDFGRVPSWADHVQLSSVCSKWREAALSCGDYWASLPFFHLTECLQFPEIFSRSKISPLSLRMDQFCCAGTLTDELLTLEPHSAHVNLRRHCAFPDPSVPQLSALFSPKRIKDVAFFADAALQEDFMRYFPDAETPLLETLILAPPRQPRSIQSRTSMQLPEHILIRPRPSLRILKLSQCSNIWQGPMQPSFPNLVHLSLDALSPPISISVLLHVLVASPRIEELRLHRAVWGLFPPEAALNKPNMPFLRSLDVGDDTSMDDAQAACLRSLYTSLIPSASRAVELEKLVIIAPASVSHITAIFPADSLAIPCHNLHKLQITRCTSPWTTIAPKPLFPNLVELALEGLNPRVPLDVLGSILASPSQLQEIRCHNSIYIPDPPPDVPPLQGISLPQLKKLNILERSAVVCALYATLIHPTSTFVDILCNGTEPVDCSALFDLCGFSRTTRTRRHGPSLTFLCTNNKFRVYLRATDSRQSLLFSIGGPYLHLQQVLAACQVDGVENLWIFNGGEWSPQLVDGWRVFFRHHPNISTLCIATEGVDGANILPALTEGGHAEDTQPPRLAISNSALAAEDLTAQQGEESAPGKYIPASPSPSHLPLPALRHLGLDFHCHGTAGPPCNALEPTRALLLGRTGRFAIPTIEIICGCANKEKLAELRDLASQQGGLTMIHDMFRPMPGN